MYGIMELETGEAMLDTSCIVYSGYETFEEAKEALETIIKNYINEFGIFVKPETFAEYKQMMKEEYNTEVDEDDYEDIDDEESIYRINDTEVRIEVNENYYVELKIIEINCNEKKVNAITF